MIVDVPLAPCVIESDAGFAPIEKSGVVVTVRVRVCELTRLPLVPVIVMLAIEARVPESTLTVAVDVIDPPAGGVTGLDEKATCTPLGNEPVFKLTAELKEPIDVTVTVSVAELPAPTIRVGELSPNEKSAPGVTVRAKDVVRVPDEPAPLIVIVLVPTEVLDATLIPKVAGALPPDGMEIGLGLKAEKVTPVGAEPVTDSVTGPEKLSCEFPVIVTVPEPPCGIEIVGADGLRLKSGAVGVSSATLFAPDSKTHMLPDESTTTSCGCVLLPIGHSVNCPFGTPTLGALVGATTFVETTAGFVAAEIATGAPPEADMAGAAAMTVPPADGSSSATFPFPAFTEFSAIQGCCVKGLILISLGSAPIVGICHSLIELSPRRTPT